MSTTIKAWPVRGGGEFLEIERETPTLRPKDLLVRVRAVSVNPVDTKQHAGLAPGAVKQLGYDAAGVVEQVGPEATGFRVGDEVYYAGDITRDGTNAQLHAVDSRIVGRRPGTLSWESAAALPLTTITAWETLFDHFRLTAGDQGHLLVVGAAGGVGSMVIQLVKALAPGVEVIATASREESAAWVRELGADHVVGHGNLVDDVRAIAPTGVHRIFSPYTRGNLPVYADLLLPFGAVVAIDEPEGQETLPLKSKSASLHWELMFSRIMHEAPDVSEQGRLLTRVAELVDDGSLRSTLTTTFDGRTDGVPEALRQAHAVLSSGHSIGKAAVRVS
ncbi:zinc-binding alcohol dehydrogenase family protein [Kineosporia sp. J2-2]|uniref:Zinc-type alcohol dehydrogenase-like protein n=1 Tax=Kineosporia corallincola TaxID=2835133 RepID=A0ABS5TCD5_9ACTN|nr:zinc-binding alcohol dehydrogenase family protein [Kineosporia corallincola]MBT0768737.1 zinc-binding alcohol dehydrogenase family protein [Kineosporia corallincola]